MLVRVVDVGIHGGSRGTRSRYDRVERVRALPLRPVLALSAQAIGMPALYCVSNFGMGCARARASGEVAALTEEMRSAVQRLWLGLMSCHLGF